jgi:hypothetical protein
MLNSGFMVLWTPQELIVGLSIFGFGLALGVYFIARGLVLLGIVAIAYYAWAVTASANRFANAHRNLEERHFHIRRMLGMILTVPLGFGIVGCAYFLIQGRKGIGLLMLLAGIVGNIVVHLVWNLFALRRARGHGA